MKRTLLIILTLSILSCEKDKKIGINSKQNIQLEKKKIEIEQLMAELDSAKDKLNELDSIKNELTDYQMRFKSIEHLSVGKFHYTEDEKSDLYGENYRIEIYLNEIYKSIYISHIEYYGEGAQRISSRVKLNFEKMTGITEEGTSTIEFIEWTNFNEFKIKTQEQHYNIRIVEPDTFIISEE